jgi:hypothetical protein
MTWIALPWRCGRSFDGYADVNKVWGTERIMGRCAGEPSFNEGAELRFRAFFIFSIGSIFFCHNRCKYQVFTSSFLVIMLIATKVIPTRHLYAAIRREHGDEL